VDSSVACHAGRRDRGLHPLARLDPSLQRLINQQIKLAAQIHRLRIKRPLGLQCCTALRENPVRRQTLREFGHKVGGHRTGPGRKHEGHAVPHQSHRCRIVARQRVQFRRPVRYCDPVHQSPDGRDRLGHLGKPLIGKEVLVGQSVQPCPRIRPRWQGIEFPYPRCHPQPCQIGLCRDQGGKLRSRIRQGGAASDGA